MHTRLGSCDARQSRGRNLLQIISRSAFQEIIMARDVERVWRERLQSSRNRVRDREALVHQLSSREPEQLLRPLQGETSQHDLPYGTFRAVRAGERADPCSPARRSRAPGRYRSDVVRMGAADRGGAANVVATVRVATRDAQPMMTGIESLSHSRPL